MLFVATHVFQNISKFYDNYLNTKDYDYGKLPPHIIANILSQLRIQEFRNASLVCKSWYYASFDPCIIKKIRVNFGHYETNCDYLVRPIRNACLSEVNWNKLHYREILNNFGSTINDLHIYSNITITQLFEILSYLPNVCCLKVWDNSTNVSSGNLYRSKRYTKYRDVIVRNLAQIKKIDIWTGVRDLNMYRLFLSYCSNLEVLHWGDDEYKMKNRDDFLFNYLLNPNENPSLYNIIDLKLNSVGTQCSKFFETLVKLELTNIKRFSISEIPTTYYDLLFKEFCITYRFLESLTISGCNDQHLIDICRHLKSLKHLTVHNCTANNLSLLVTLTQLELLHINRIDLNSPPDDLRILWSSEHKLLKRLCINQIDATVFKLICENCQNLEDLFICGLDTQDCEPLFRNMVKLKKLSLSFREPPAKHSSRIKSSDRYNITNLTQLEDIFVSCFVPGITPELIHKLPKLKMGCDYIWDPTEEELTPLLTGVWDDAGIDADITLDIENTDVFEMEEKNVIYDISDFNWCQELIL